MTADVIVVGAGPAGATAARALALAGRNVLLLDRASFPRNKPCGGGISARALLRFPWLESGMAGIDVHATNRLHLQSPNGQVMEIRSDDPAVWLIRRVAFDDMLARSAVTSGACLLEKTEIAQAEEGPDVVTLRSRDGRTFSAPFVVAADGVHSVVARRLRIRQQWDHAALAIDMMEETPHDRLRPVDSDVLRVAYAYRGMEGYAYVFPKKHHVNVGIGCLRSRFSRDRDGHPYLLQSMFVSELVRLGILVGESDRASFTPFLIPVGGPMRRPYTGRVLFCGDAGGFVNAFTAEGIYYAMLSGELAGRALSGKGRPGPRYRRLLRQECTSELRESVLIQRYLLSCPERVDRLVELGQQAEWLPKLLVDYAAGRMSYFRARRMVLAASPKALVRLAALALNIRCRRWRRSNVSRDA